MEQLSVTIQTDYIKLDSLLKFAGLCAVSYTHLRAHET